MATVKHRARRARNEARKRLLSARAAVEAARADLAARQTEYERARDRAAQTRRSAETA